MVISSSNELEQNSLPAYFEVSHIFLIAKTDLIAIPRRIQGLAERVF